MKTNKARELTIEIINIFAVEYLGHSEADVEFMNYGEDCEGSDLFERIQKTLEKI